MLNKVEDILQATAPELVVCQLCDEVIQESFKSLNSPLFRCKTLDKRCSRRKNPEMKAKVERGRTRDMDKFKCIGFSLRTDDNDKRSLVQRKETVQYITTDGHVQPREEDLWRALVGQGIILGLPEAVVRLLARGSEGEVEIGFGVTSRAAGRCEKIPPRFSTSRASALRKGPS